MHITKMLALALVVALMAGCVPSLRPLYTKDDPIFDPALVGTWVDGDGDQWIFSKSDDNSYELVEKPKEGARAHFKAHLVQFGSLRFLDLSAEKLDVQEELVKNGMFWLHAVPAHTIWKIQLAGDTFHLSALDLDWLGERLKKKKVTIAHQVLGDKEDQILLTAPTRQLQAFVVRYAGEAFDRDPAKFQRQK